MVAFLLFFVLGMTTLYAIKIEFHDFKNKQQEQLYLALIAELRCVQCQNQNLAESNAELAGDMREKVYEIVLKGGSRNDVVKYMTDRYGDFVLYKPPFKMKTLLLWFGPAILLLLSLYYLLKRIRQQERQAATDVLTDEQREKMRELLNETPHKNPNK
jgi:cytochrome c-type biogenesis protein CcmH